MNRPCGTVFMFHLGEIKLISLCHNIFFRSFPLHFWYSRHFAVELGLYMPNTCSNGYRHLYLFIYLFIVKQCDYSCFRLGKVAIITKCSGILELYSAWCFSHCSHIREPFFLLFTRTVPPPPPPWLWGFLAHSEERRGATMPLSLLSGKNLQINVGIAFLTFFSHFWVSLICTSR